VVKTALGIKQRREPCALVPPFTLYAVYTNRQYVTPKLRTFIDFFSEALGGGKSLSQQPDR